MTPERINRLLRLGENIAIEFKRCGNGIETDTYESVCAFLNRFGGDLFLGVENDGTVRGVPYNSALDMGKEIALAIHHNNLTKLRNGIMAALLEEGLVELTQPDSPRSPTQKYRLTSKGKAYLAQLNGSAPTINKDMP